MEGVRWDYAHKRMAICRRWEIPALLSTDQTARCQSLDWQWLQIHGLDDARRAIGHAGDQVWKLRPLLARNCYNLPFMSDAQVVDEIYLLLARGELIIVEQTRCQAHVSAVDLPGAIAHSVPPQAQPSHKVTDRARALSVAERAPSIHKPKVEPADPFDQDAQAATLRLAAANATPFCEVCQKREPLHSIQGAA